MNLKTTLQIPVLLLAASLALAAQKPPVAKSAAPAAAAQDKADLKPMVAAQSKDKAKALKAQKAKKAKAQPKAKLVDINGATKEELKMLPGITDAFADKIVAGRPYRTKIHLVTHGVLPVALFESIKARIYAKQNLAKH